MQELAHGPKRNVAWRVLDAKFFGLPQQKKKIICNGRWKGFLPRKYIVREA
ncbi:MAG: hypothetical protein ACLSEY_08145 [Enterocloster sp.]